MAKAAVTPKGKEVSYRRNPRGNFEVYFTSGGELPQELQGEFTNQLIVEAAINVFINKKQLEVKTDPIPKVDG